MSRPRVRAALVAILGAVAVAVAVAVAAFALALRPQPPVLGGRVAGDARLVADLGEAIGDERGRRGIAAASVEEGRVSTAGLGRRGPEIDAAPTPTTRFELGSVTKGLTGMLLAELAADGTVRLEQPVSDLLPRLRGTAAGEATLEELASHRSGLPRLPPDPARHARAAAANLAAANPYAGITPTSLIEAAAGSEIDGRGEYAYSNLGMSLLGQALAARAGTSYPELLERRVLGPIGMRDTVVLDPGEPPPAGAAAGSWANGRPATPRGAGPAPWPRAPLRS